MPVSEKTKEAILHEHYQKIGAMGGKKSKRVLTHEQALELVKIRESKKKSKLKKSGRKTKKG